MSVWGCEGVWGVTCEGEGRSGLGSERVRVSRKHRKSVCVCWGGGVDEGFEISHRVYEV